MSSRLKPGTLLRGKWRIDKLLGSGGMSTVYAATHRNGMRGAIKVLHPELNTNELLRSRFLREGYAANKVDHPRAVKVLDEDSTEDGLVFLVMELLEGSTLKERWIQSDRRLEVATTVDIVEQVLDVLESAHERGIVHRDLKPDNIFLLRDGGVKVLDFGIARVLESAALTSAGSTSSAAMMGTPAFMPPEQALAYWDKVDGRSDLYAVAATAFTVLSGRLVHSGSTIPELLVAAATKQVPPIHSVLPDLPDSIADVIDRGLRFEIEERWADARSMRLALLQARTRAAGAKTMRISTGDVPRKLPFAAPPDAETVRRPAPAEPSSERGADTVVDDAETELDRIAQSTPTAMHFANVPSRPARQAITARISEGTPSSERVPTRMLEATPVRLQGAMHPLHAAHLRETKPAPSSRRAKTALWAGVGLAAGAGVTLLVLLGTRTSPRPKAADPSTSATAESSPPDASSSLDRPLGPRSRGPIVRRVETTSTEGDSPSASPSPSPSASSFAPASSSASAIPQARRPTTAGPRPVPPPPRPPVAPPPPCVRDDFTGRCK